MSFGERLRSLIDEQGLTQKELAGKLSIAPSTLSSYVQDAREPDFATLKALATFFGVSTDYLLEHSSAGADSRTENELLRIFRALVPEHQELYLEQGRAFIRVKAKKAGASSHSPAKGADRAG